MWNIYNCFEVEARWNTAFWSAVILNDFVKALDCLS